MEKLKTIILAGILLCILVFTINYSTDHKKSIVLEQQTPEINTNIQDSVVQLSENRIGIITANKEISIFEYDEKNKNLVMIGRYDYSDFYSHGLQKVR